MLDKKELLHLSVSMDIEPRYEKFYRFVMIFAAHSVTEKATDASVLFDCVKYCLDNPVQAKERMGISGRDTEPIKRWCRYILNKKELRELSLTELDYVFACCARLCKAKAG